MHSDPHEVPAGLQRRIEAAILPQLKPVRPLPATSFLTLQIIAACAGVTSLAVAMRGWTGVQIMTPTQAVSILLSLTAAGITSAVAVARLMVPAAGSAGVVRAAMVLLPLPLLVTSSLVEVNQHPEFSKKAAGCFTLGMVCALAAAAVVVPQVRRGAVLRTAATAALTGCVIAFSAVLFQEIYCPIIDVRHKLMAHLSLFAVWAISGWLFRGIFRLSPAPRPGVR
jgi:hypothetical protein